MKRKLAPSAFLIFFSALLAAWVFLLSQPAGTGEPSERVSLAEGGR